MFKYIGGGALVGFVISFGSCVLMPKHAGYGIVGTTLLGALVGFTIAFFKSRK